MASHVLAFVLRLAVSSGVLWLAVRLVSPENPANTWQNAVLVSIALSVAYYLTLAKFLWFLFLPWILYVAIWLAVVITTYGVGFWQAFLLAVLMAVLSWVVSAVSGVKTLRSE